MKLFYFICLCALLLTGCVSTYKFRPFVGVQREWPVSSAGCIMDTDGPLPIYYGLPSKPYDVIGMMTANANSIGMASRNAKYHGGEAMVLINASTFQGGSINIPGTSSTTTTGNISGGNYYSNSHTYNSPSVNIPVITTFENFAVIKFKTQRTETTSSPTNTPTNN